MYDDITFTSSLTILLFYYYYHFDFPYFLFSLFFLFFLCFSFLFLNNISLSSRCPVFHHQLGEENNEEIGTMELFIHTLFVIMSTKFEDDDFQIAECNPLSLCMACFYVSFNVYLYVYVLFVCTIRKITGIDVLQRIRITERWSRFKWSLHFISWYCYYSYLLLSI